MSDHAELDSSATTIEDLIRRISDAAERYQGLGDENTAYDLYEVERSLRAAARRLETVVRRLS